MEGNKKNMEKNPRNYPTHINNSFYFTSARFGSLQKIVSFSPKNSSVAVVKMRVLFAIKTVPY